MIELQLTAVNFLDNLLRYHVVNKIVAPLCRVL